MNGRADLTKAKSWYLSEMNIVDELTRAFQKTFDDKQLSRNERKALKSMLKEVELDQRKMDILRSKVFDIGEKGIKNMETRFVLEWVEDATRLLEHSQGSHAGPEKSSVYFSPGEECKDAILTRIGLARKQLDICVFTISDNEISDALLDRHHQRLPIRILTDNDKTYDKGSDIMRLAEAGIPVKIDRTEYHMHHKFAVIDQQTAITGSYNWTRSARVYNQENILVTAEESVVGRYNAEFKRLWEKMDFV